MINRTPSQTTISHYGVSDYTMVFYVRKRIDSLIKREGYGPVNLGLWGDSLVVTWLILSHFPVVPNFKLWGLFNLIKKKNQALPVHVLGQKADCGIVPVLNQRHVNRQLNAVMQHVGPTM